MAQLFKLPAVRHVLCAIALVCGAVPALAGVAVVVDARSTENPMTLAQVDQLFTARTFTLPSGVGAVLIDQAEGNSVREEFYRKVTRQSATGVKALRSRQSFSGFSQPPEAVANDSEVKKAVVKVPGSIGYIDSGAIDDSVKVLLHID